MQALPVFLDVRGKPCLLVGDGEVAQRKRRLLERAGAEIQAIPDGFSDSHLDGMLLVVAASDNAALNRQVSAVAQARGIPVNVVDQPELCTFIFPALVERGPITVAVSSGGALPVLTRLLRARIETLLPPSLADFATRAGMFRTHVKQRLPDLRQRMRFWDGVLQQQLIGARSDLQVLDTARELEQQLQAFASGETSGRITVVGAGPGDPDLLTFRALRCLQACDAVFCDASVSPAIAELARRDASQHILPTDADVAVLLAAAAEAGQNVVYLTSGDPSACSTIPVMLTQWQSAGITAGIVPGVSNPSGVNDDAV